MSRTWLLWWIGGLRITDYTGHSCRHVLSAAVNAVHRMQCISRKTAITFKLEWMRERNGNFISVLIMEFFKSSFLLHSILYHPSGDFLKNNVFLIFLKVVVQADMSYYSSAILLHKVITLTKHKKCILFLINCSSIFLKKDLYILNAEIKLIQEFFKEKKKRIMLWQKIYEADFTNYYFSE